MRSTIINIAQQWSWILWPLVMLVWAWWLFMVVPVSANTHPVGVHQTIDSGRQPPIRSANLNVRLPNVSKPVALSGDRVSGDDWMLRRHYPANSLPPFERTWIADHQAAMYAVSVMF